MNFRLVWVGADDERPGRQPAAHDKIAATRHVPSGMPRYERQGSEMVRCERLANGELKRTAVANFSARIVCDLILDDDAERRRELAIEAELVGQRVAFVVPASE